MTQDQIILTKEKSIATITLNRPEKLNAISDHMRSALAEALTAVEADPDIRGLIITGTGRAFCAGGDIAAMKSRMELPIEARSFNGWRRQQQVHHTQELLYMLSKPTVAAVNGVAAGLGADIALACDQIIASSKAAFSWAYVKRGLIPDGGGMYFLPRRVGLTKAKNLMYTGRHLSAAEAYEFGIVDRQVEPDELLKAAYSLAKDLTAESGTAIALTKTILNRSFELSLSDVFALGSQAQGICYVSAEHKVSIDRFLEKRVSTNTNCTE